MAKYIIKGCDIIVEGEHIKSKEDAITELQIALDAYDDMNDTDSSITIKNLINISEV